jgi:hypothetical protein
MCKPHKQNHAPRKMVEEANPSNRRARERGESEIEDYWHEKWLDGDDNLW